MKLSHLAFACYLYGAFTDFDKSYENFLKVTGYSPDLTISKHRNELLIWLNSWGCRQFSLEYHELASKEILSWYNEHNAALPITSRDLWELSEDEFASLGLAYESLLKRTASLRKLKSGNSIISIGPTGASKILFAIRPKALIPWDDSIRQHNGYGSERESYLAYHRHIKKMVGTLKEQCQGYGFQLTDLPKVLNRPYSSVPKLIDEYQWVTISKNCAAPNYETLLTWAKWDQN
jgi:hypothetical protein